MTFRKRVAGILILVAAAVAAVALIARPAPNRAEAAGQPGGEAKTTAEAEIRKANADYAAAMTAGDVDGIMAFWAADADYVDEAGQQTKGADKIAALFKKAAPDTKGWKTAVRVTSLKFLRPEICLEDGMVERTAPTGVK